MFTSSPLCFPFPLPFPPLPSRCTLLISTVNTSCSRHRAHGSCRDGRQPAPVRVQAYLSFLLTAHSFISLPGLAKLRLRRRVYCRASEFCYFDFEKVVQITDLAGTLYLWVTGTIEVFTHVFALVFLYPFVDIYCCRHISLRCIQEAR